MGGLGLLAPNLAPRFVICPLPLVQLGIGRPVDPSDTASVLSAISDYGPQNLHLSIWHLNAFEFATPCQIWSTFHCATVGWVSRLT